MKKISELNISKKGKKVFLNFVLKTSEANKCFVISDRDGNILIKGFLENTKQHQIVVTALKKGKYFVHIIDGEKLFFESFEIG
ncbi:MAG TPA: hypothetical protein VNG53_11820 [Bacteroidia bacterium]|nr:hypothetical protein [Bacteroidia bacterium]